MIVSGSLPQRIRRIWIEEPWIKRSLELAFAYILWLAVFQFLIVTFATWLLVSSAPLEGSSPRFKLEEINEFLLANQVIFAALASTSFVLMLRALNPLTSTRTSDFFRPALLERQFVPGFQSGALLGTGVILAFVLSGTYRYLGVLVQMDEAPLAVLGISLRTLALASLVYFDEYVFRDRLLRSFKRPQSGFAGDCAAALGTAILYALVKAVQFDLGWMQTLTVFLLATALGFRAYNDDGFARGAGYWAAILIIFHPILSLPIFGNDFSGLFLVKWQAPTDTLSDAVDATRFLTGGAGGPLASFAFQVFLFLDILRGVMQHQTRHLENRPSEITPS